MWTHFQKIYSWRRYRPFKTISKTWFTSVTLLRFWFRIIASKLLIFEVCLSLKERLVATFDETRAPTSRKSEVFQDLDIPKLTPKYKFLCHTPAFSFLNNGLKNDNFWSSFASEKTAGNYFDWNTSIHLQKLWSY